MKGETDDGAKQMKWTYCNAFGGFWRGVWTYIYTHDFVSLKMYGIPMPKQYHWMIVCWLQWSWMSGDCWIRGSFQNSDVLRLYVIMAHPQFNSEEVYESGGWHYQHNQWFTRFLVDSCMDPLSLTPAFFFYCRIGACLFLTHVSNLKTLNCCNQWSLSGTPWSYHQLSSTAMSYLTADWYRWKPAAGRLSSLKLLGRQRFWDGPVLRGAVHVLKNGKLFVTIYSWRVMVSWSRTRWTDL